MQALKLPPDETKGPFPMKLMIVIFAVVILVVGFGIGAYLLFDDLYGDDS